MTEGSSEAGARGVKESRRFRVCSREPCDHTLGAHVRVPLTPVSAQDTKERKPQATPWGRRSSRTDGCQTACSGRPTPVPEGATGSRELWGWGASGSGGRRRSDLRPQGREVCLSWRATGCNPPSPLRLGTASRPPWGASRHRKVGISGPRGTEVGQAVSARPVPCPPASATRNSNILRAWHGGGAFGRAAGPGLAAGVAPAMRSR